MSKMRSTKKNNKRIVLLTVISAMLTAVLVLSGVGIYLKVAHKEKNPIVEVNPLDFSIDTWDGSVEAINFNENYAGRGTKTKTINSAASFAHFIQEVNNGNDYADHTIYLNSSIDLNGQTINSIGTSEHPFKGTFDGGHYTIYNAKVNGKGLFGVTEGATIKNIGLYNANTNLIGKAINTNVENTFVRLGNSNLIGEYVTNDGKYYVRRSFVDNSSQGIIEKLDTNSSSANGVVIADSYYTNGNSSVNEEIGEAYYADVRTIKATKLSDFEDWDYSAEYDSDKKWTKYDYLQGSRKLSFNYPVQSGFVKTYLTGSCYESVMVTDNKIVDVQNLAEAFKEADKEDSAEINLLVEKIFMEAQATVESAEVKVNAVKDTTIVRGENNTSSMFVGNGTSKIVLGEEQTTRATTPTLTLDGNREYVEEQGLKSDALVVANGSTLVINENVIIKDNINNDNGYGGGVLLVNTDIKAELDGTIENCFADYGGGFAAIRSKFSTSVDFKNCKAKHGGALYISGKLPNSLQTLNSNVENFNIQPMDNVEMEDGTEITTGTFKECSSWSGGAIWCDGSLTINGEDVEFSQNQAYGDNGTEGFGGAVYVSATLTIGKATFDKNHTVSKGGAVYANTININDNAAFNENYATPSSDQYIDLYGGAVYAEDKVVISGAPTFTQNTMLGPEPNHFYGGAISANNLVQITGDPIFKRNGSYHFHGGVIYTPRTIEISGKPQFVNNRGGALSGLNITISNRITIKNNGYSYLGEQANEIYVQHNTSKFGGTLTLSSDIDMEPASGSVGIYLSGSSGYGSIVKLQMQPENFYSVYKENITAHDSATDNVESYIYTVEGVYLEGATSYSPFYVTNLPENHYVSYNGEMIDNGYGFVTTPAPDFNSAVFSKTEINAVPLETVSVDVVSKNGFILPMITSEIVEPITTSVGSGLQKIQFKMLKVGTETISIEGTTLTFDVDYPTDRLWISTEELVGDAGQTFDAVYVHVPDLYSGVSITSGDEEIVKIIDGTNINQNSVSINQNGLINISNYLALVGVGETDIIIESSENLEFGKSSITLHVKVENYVSSLSSTNVTVYVGDSIDLSIQNEELTEGVLLLSCNNYSALGVDTQYITAGGGTYSTQFDIGYYLEAISAGNATLQVLIIDSAKSGVIFEDVNIVINEPWFTLNQTDMEIYLGRDLDVSITPLDFGNDAYAWVLITSTIPEVVTVSAATDDVDSPAYYHFGYSNSDFNTSVSFSDYLTVVGEGETTITLKAMNVSGEEYSKSFNITVKAVPTITLSHSEIYVKLDEKVNVTASWPNQFVNETLYISTADPEVVQVVSSSRLTIATLASTFLRDNLTVKKVGVSAITIDVYADATSSEILYSLSLVVHVEDPVALIYDEATSSWEYYDTLESAFTNAEDNDVIVLDKTYYLKDYLVIKKNLTLVAHNNAILYIDESLMAKSVAEEKAVIYIQYISGNIEFQLGYNQDTYNGLILTPLIIDGQYIDETNNVGEVYRIMDAYGVDKKLIMEKYANNYVEIRNFKTNYDAIDVKILTINGAKITNIISERTVLRGYSETLITGGTVITNCVGKSYIIHAYAPEKDILIDGLEMVGNQCEYAPITTSISINCELKNIKILNSTSNWAIDIYGGQNVYLENIEATSNTNNDIIIFASDERKSVKFGANIKVDQIHPSLVTDGEAFPITFVADIASTQNYELHVGVEIAEYYKSNTPIIIFEEGVTADIGRFTLSDKGYKFITQEDAGVTKVYVNPYQGVVNFDVNGGDELEESLKTKTITHGEAYGDLPTPTRVGHTFKGWYKYKTNYEETDKVEPTTIVPELKVDGASVTLYAQWEPINLVILASVGENGSMDTLGSVEVDYGTSKTFTFSANTGYVVSEILIDGVALSGAELETAIASGKYVFSNIESDHSIYVGFALQVLTVSFVVNNSCAGYGSIVVSELEVNYGTSVTFEGNNINVGGNIIVPLPEEKTSQYTYAFDRWSPNVATSVTTDLEFVAFFTRTINKYTLTFSVHEDCADYGAISGPTEVEVDYGSEITMQGNVITLIDGEDTYVITAQPSSKTAEYSYRFVNWEGEINLDQGKTSMFAHFEPVLNIYTIIWENEGIKLEEVTGNYGEVVNYSLAEPTKPADTQYSYTFAGWDVDDDGDVDIALRDEITITGNATYKAVFTPITNTFTVTWVDDDGTVLETDNDVAYGTTPTYDGETPTKEQDAQYSYTFSGWTPVISPVQANVTYTANYTSVLRTYTIIWRNEDGTVLETDENIKYGSWPTYNGPTPEKSITLEYSYAFIGWTPKVHNVNGDQTYTAQYSITANKYTITYDLNYETANRIYTTQQVPYGTVITLPTPNPERVGYDFAGWYFDPEYTDDLTNDDLMPASDITVIARWLQNAFTLTIDWGFDNERTTITDEAGNERTIIVKTRTGYSFNGLYYLDGQTEKPFSYIEDGESQIKVSIPNNDLTVYATWSVNNYLFSIDYNYDGAENPDPQTVAYQGDVQLPAIDPTRTGYTFTGWYKDSNCENAFDYSTMPAENITAYAGWSINSYTISYKWTYKEGNYETVTQEYNSPIQVITAPTREGYTFEYWCNEEDCLTEFTLTNVPAEDISVYAKWKANTYMVTFDVNGGDELAETDKTKEVTFDSEYGPLPTPELTGYTFAGWFTLLNNGDIVEETTTVTTAENHTLYAHWTANTYTVTFNVNNGEELEESDKTKDVVFNTEYGVLPTTSREGYAFVGWYTQLEGGDKVTATTLVSIAQDHTLYAQWSAGDYIVTFDARGGSSSSANISVTFGEEYGTLPTATRTGYTFTGWYTLAEDGDIVEPTTTVTTADNHTLYAQWTANTYTVTFDVNGGVDLEEIDKTRVVTFGNEYGILPTVIRNGYTFTGWFTQPEGGNKVEATTIVVIASDHGLYARWTANAYEVTFNANGGTANMEKLSVRYGGQYGPLATAERQGYVFEGWFTQLVGGDKVEASTIVTTAENHILYARWYANTYKVTFDVNGGEELADIYKVKYVEFAAAYGDLPAVLRTGYTFTGWYTQSEGGDKIEETTIVTTAENHTLYAQWSSNQFVIVYYINDGETNREYITQTYNYNDKIALPTAPTRTEYRFVDWYKEASCENLFDYERMPANNLEVYAGWEIKKFTITSNVEGNGSISINSSEVVNYGSTLSFTLSAEVGYYVSQIIIDDVSYTATQIANIVQNGYSFENITDNHEIYIKLEIVKYDINVICGNGGSTSHNGITSHDFGSDVTIAITPDLGCSIEKILVDGELVTDDYEEIMASGYTISNITKNYTIEVYFISNQFSIIVEKEGRGTIKLSNIDSPLDSGAYIAAEYGDSKTFIIQEVLGSHIYSIIVDGRNLTGQELVNAKNNGYTFANIDSDHTIKVVFKTDTFKITINILEGEGNIVPNKDISKVEYGDSITFTIDTNFDKYSVEVYVNGKKLNVSTDFVLDNINEDINIEVKFIKKAFIETKSGIAIIIASVVVAMGLIVLVFVVTRIRRNRRTRLIK